MAGSTVEDGVNASFDKRFPKDLFYRMFNELTLPGVIRPTNSNYTQEDRAALDIKVLYDGQTLPDIVRDYHRNIDEAVTVAVDQKRLHITDSSSMTRDPEHVRTAQWRKMVKGQLQEKLADRVDMFIRQLSSDEVKNALERAPAEVSGKLDALKTEMLAVKEEIRAGMDVPALAGGARR